MSWPGYGIQNWLRYMPPGMPVSTGPSAKAARESGPPVTVSRTQAAGTTCWPVSDVPSARIIAPNRARSRSTAEIPPSNIPVPTASTAMLASCSAPRRLHSRLDMSSGIRVPAAASHTQPSTSLSQLRYSNGPPCGPFLRSVSRKSYMVPGTSGSRRGAQPIACSSSRTSAAGSR